MMSSPSMEEMFGKTLAALLKEARLSPRELERRLDLPATTVDRLLAGRETLDLDVLRRVLTVVGVTPETFFARMFNPGGQGETPQTSPGRQQVAGLIDRVRAALEEIRSLGPPKG